jgi:hypothetical protein
LFAVPYWTLGGSAALAYGLSVWFRFGWHGDLPGWFGLAALHLALPAGYVRTVWLSTWRRPIGRPLRWAGVAVMLIYIGWHVASHDWPRTGEGQAILMAMLAPLPVWLYAVTRGDRS